MYFQACFFFLGWVVAARVKTRVDWRQGPPNWWQPWSLGDWPGMVDAPPPPHGAQDRVWRVADVTLVGFCPPAAHTRRSEQEWFAAGLGTCSCKMPMLMPVMARAAWRFRWVAQLARLDSTPIEKPNFIRLFIEQ